MAKEEGSQTNVTRKSTRRHEIKVFFIKIMLYRQQCANCKQHLCTISLEGETVCSVHIFERQSQDWPRQWE